MIGLHPYRLPLATPYRWAKGERRERIGMIVRCNLDGAIGWGECAPDIQLHPDPDAMAAKATALVGDLDVRSPDFLESLDAR